MIGKDHTGTPYRFDIRDTPHRFCEVEIEGHNPELVTAEIEEEDEEGKPIFSKGPKVGEPKEPLDKHLILPSNRAGQGVARWH